MVVSSDLNLSFLDDAVLLQPLVLPLLLTYLQITQANQQILLIGTKNNHILMNQQDIMCVNSFLWTNLAKENMRMPLSGHTFHETT